MVNNLKINIMKKVVKSLSLILVGLSIVFVSTASVVVSVNKSSKTNSSKKSTVYGQVNFTNQLQNLKLTSFQEKNSTMFLNYSRSNITYIIPLKYKYKVSKFKTPSPTN